MKRIFLTSGIILCMACPAFADLTAPTTDHPNGTVVGSDPVVDPSCQYPTLEGYSGTSTFTAQWSRAYIDVVLNPNTSNQNGAATGSTFTTGTYETDKLYSTTASMYKTYDTANQALANILAGGDAVLVYTEQSPLPQGHSVQLSFDPNISYINGTLNTGNATSYTASSVASMPAQDTQIRAFKGFFGTANGGDVADAYINTSGQITSAGITAATTAAEAGENIEWYADYNCAAMTHDGTPTLRGYRFDAWYADSTLETPVEDWCMTAATNTVYAKWTAHTGTLTYDCGALPANSQGTLSGGSTESVTFDHAVTLKNATGEGGAGCSVQGYHFVGWKCDYNLATGASNSNDAINYPFANGAFTGGANVIAHYQVAAAGVNGAINDADVTCVAQWEANSIGLQWNANGGTATGGGETCTYDGTIQLPTYVDKPGYTFNGWSVTNSAN